MFLVGAVPMPLPMNLGYMPLLTELENGNDLHAIDMALLSELGRRFIGTSNTLLSLFGSPTELGII